MDRLRKLIEQHGLEEDAEHVIIPIRMADGRLRRIHVLHRPYLLVRRDVDHAVTVAIEDIVEAILRNPDGRLWDVLRLSERESARLAEAETLSQDSPEVGGISGAVSGADAIRRDSSDAD